MMEQNKIYHAESCTTRRQIELGRGSEPVREQPNTMHKKGLVEVYTLSHTQSTSNDRGGDGLLNL